VQEEPAQEETAQEEPVQEKPAQESPVANSCVQETVSKERVVIKPKPLEESERPLVRPREAKVERIVIRPRRDHAPSMPARPDPQRIVIRPALTSLPERSIPISPRREKPSTAAPVLRGEEEGLDRAPIRIQRKVKPEDER
jgi:hypothetical protein